MSAAAEPADTVAPKRADATDQAGLLHAMLRLLKVVGAAMAAVFFAIFLFVQFGMHASGSANGSAAGGEGLGWGFAPEAVLVLAAAVAAFAVLLYGLRRLEGVLQANALEQARFLDTLDTRYVDVAIIGAAALSLFLELALIRWQSSVLEFLAFYKNFSLLACFAGLGLGYALAGRSRIPLVLVMPLLAVQFGFVMIARAMPGVFDVNPFRELLAMGVQDGTWAESLVLFLLLAVIFLLTALTLVPVGQLCGRLMERRGNLRAYGLNILGSLFGVLIMLVASFLWTPPLVWFAICFVGILLFHLRRPASLITGSVSALICAIVLAWWPIDTLWNRVHSPYQLLEIGTDPDSGLVLIRAAGHFYQHIHDLSGSAQSSIRDYYDFPYNAHPHAADLAVVGAGTGNDVAAALRAGAKHVNAIEIDPAIIAVGKQSHPEHPYADPRVTVVNTDARTFLRQTADKFDMIIYGMLDSHTLLSVGSSVRLDSFVYTVEGLREARSRLKPDGLISLSFFTMSETMARKIFLMLREAFDGRAPLAFMSVEGYGMICLISNDPNWTPPSNLQNTTFKDVTAKYANSSLAADVSTDDWPFFYMPQRVYPVSYLIMIAQILLLSLLLVGNFIGASPRFSHLSFFFLGVGFMLIETKGISEMGLTFGNTWQVIGIVIAGILVMAFIGNCLVQWLHIKRRLVPYLCLFAALAIGWVVARSGGFASTPLGRIETLVVLSLPLLFSGIVFSTLLSQSEHVAGIMAMNLFGAMFGGLLEYNSMYFGFQALYVIAMIAYVLAFVSEALFRGEETAALPAALAQAEGG